VKRFMAWHIILSKEEAADENPNSGKRLLNWREYPVFPIWLFAQRGNFAEKYFFSFESLNFTSRTLITLP